MVFSLLRGASPSKEKAKFQPLILHCSESSYRSVSDTGGRIGFSARIKYYLNHKGTGTVQRYGSG
jgi:hypothetical protein